MKSRAAASRIARGALVLAAIWCGSGCTIMAADTVLATKDTAQGLLKGSSLQSHAVRSIKTISINRVAVMPLVDAAAAASGELAPGAAETVTAELFSQVSVAGGWEAIAQQDVAEAMQKLPPTSTANLDENAIKLGHDVSADGVIYGTVERYRERVGMDYSASEPAAVTFALKFLDTKSGQVVWTAKFAKSQQALSQNMFDLANFVQRSGRWVRAHEIAMEGVQQAVADLHGDLNLQENVKRFETGTYGQLKSGGKRYSSGPEGIQ